MIQFKTYRSDDGFVLSPHRDRFRQALRAEGVRGDVALLSGTRAAPGSLIINYSGGTVGEFRLGIIIGVRQGCFNVIWAWSSATPQQDLLR
jgi:hypothetical protein